MGETGRPVALIATVCRWGSTVQLAKALSSVGFEIGFVAPARHPVDGSSVACYRTVLSSLRPSSSIVAAIERIKPDIIIPADETILLLLHRLYRKEPGLRALIERSLGAPEYYGKTWSRVAFADLARAEGVAAPETLRLTSEYDILHAVTRVGLPAFMKVDASWGGAGVIRVETVEDCGRAYRRLNSFRGILRKIWHMASDRAAVRLPFQREGGDISIQSAVAGAPANCAVAAWRGEMLACVEAVAVQTLGPTGASTVVRVLHDGPMQQACRRLVKRFELSGLIGFDFILEQETGRAVVIELNARATQTCHLRLGRGADPPEALRAAVTGEPIREMPTSVEERIIELFPQGRSATGGATSTINSPNLVEG